jgi:thiol:disulfide interchange protein DsbA
MNLSRFVIATFLPALLACSVAAAATQTSAGSQTPVPALIEGQDYVRIVSGTPLATSAGQVEIAELFNYACPACNGFSPLVRAWKTSLPAYAHFIYVPMDFRPDFVQYAHAYYAAEALGVVEKSHDAVFAAIHVTHKLPGEGAPQNAAEIAKFYAQFGVNAAEFQKTMDSFSVNMKTANARQFATRSQVTSTPSLVIDGKYLVTGKSWQESLRIAGQLIVKAHESPAPRG